MRQLLPFLMGCLTTSLTMAQSGTGLPGSALGPAVEPASWAAVRLGSPGHVQLDGVMGVSLRRGVDRLALAPYTADWLLSDVSFKVKRIFTNYSGDVSGRFIELGALTSRPDQLKPAGTLPAVLDAVLSYQKPDGHFGVDVDFGKPIERNSAGVTLLWGNARMLVGLVTAHRELRRPEMLAAARKLGDYYLDTADQLCSPRREIEYHATGTAADSYQVGYFPAMEGLVMLHEETKDARYLQLAERMADFFLRFDVLPSDHSHGNLSAWRSLLDLHRVTGKRAYLEQAISKWSESVARGYVWSIGGVGEHWYVNYNGSEGCSESDWLRFNLDLWRHTGDVRYLEMAERLLHNQYLADQTPNGGYGMRHFDVEAAGPVGTAGGVHEWDFCCSFHGPLGLHFLKGYLAAGSDREILVNFPLDFATQVNAGGSEWRVEARESPGFDPNGEKRVTVRVAPVAAASSPVTVRLRSPAWADQVRVDGAQGRAAVENGYVVLSRDARANQEFVVTFQAKPAIEGRKFAAVRAEPGKVSRVEDVVLTFGPHVLFELPAREPGRSNLLATVDDKGRVDLLRNADGSFASVKLPSADVSPEQVVAALESARKVSLATWPVPTTRRTAFAYDLVVVPANLIPPDARSKFAARLMDSQVPHYGANLERNPSLWPAQNWKFGPDGVLITGGDVGLIDGQPYGDYRFEFDLTLPAAGQGITGWVVRARDEANCVMFQLQGADSEYRAPEFKTRPNTLRPIVRTNGSWDVKEPIPLPKEVRKGETHRIATECRGGQIKVFLNGELIHEQNDDRWQAGAVGFRVSHPLDRGLFRNITLQKR